MSSSISVTVDQREFRKLATNPRKPLPARRGCNLWLCWWRAANHYVSQNPGCGLPAALQHDVMACHGRARFDHLERWQWTRVNFWSPKPMNRGRHQNSSIARCFARSWLCPAACGQRPCPTNASAGRAEAGFRGFFYGLHCPSLAPRQPRERRCAGENSV